MELIALTPRDWERVKRMLAAFDAGQLGRRGDRADGEFNDPPTVSFRNDAAETAPAYGLLRVTDPFDEDGEKVLTIGKPNASFQRRYLVNGPDDVPAGQRGAGTWLWDADYVLCDSGATPAFGESWGAKDDSWILWQHRPGFFAVGGTLGEASDNTLRMRALQDVVDCVLGKADAAITINNPGTVRVYGGTPGSEVDLGQTIASCFAKTIALADEDWVTVSWLHGKPYVVKFVC